MVPVQFREWFIVAQLPVLSYRGKLFRRASPPDFSLERGGRWTFSPGPLMIYSLKLETALVLVGLLLIALSGWALLQPRAAQEWLRALPRSKSLGFLLLTVSAIWFFVLVQRMDLGEFTTWRRTVLIGTPIAWFLAWKYVDEFLAARALGMLALLAAEPLLEAAFLRPETSRLFLVTLVYVLIALALFWVGMPFTLRDQIGWLTASPKRWRLGMIAGVAYGVLLAVLPLTYAKPL